MNSESKRKLTDSFYDTSMRAQHEKLAQARKTAGLNPVLPKAPDTSSSNQKGEQHEAD